MTIEQAAVEAIGYALWQAHSSDIQVCEGVTHTMQYYLLSKAYEAAVQAAGGYRGTWAP